MNYEQIIKNWKKVFLVDMRKENSHIFSELATKWIKKILNQNKKILILVNKKWYSNWSICKDCWFIPKCKNCDITISYHLNQAWEEFWLCHICKTQYEKFLICPNCQSKNIMNYGYGTQQIKEIIKQQFNTDSLIIESQKANSIAKTNLITTEINKYKIIIWTSLLTTPMANIDFDLIIFLNADMSLNIPDFNSNWRNFLFIYETLINYKTENYIVQTFNPWNYSIQYAIRLDILWFKKTELKNRLSFNYPPYTQMCAILYKDEIEEKLFNKINTLFQELLFLKEKYWNSTIEIFSTPALIYKMFGKYRYNIILKWNNLREFMDIAFSKLKILSRWFKIDREPENIV